MTWTRRLLALGLVGLAIFGVAIWAPLVDRYVDASEVRVSLPNHVRYADIVIPPITSDEQNVTVGVLFQVANPSDIGISILSISYRFYMDDVSDPQPFVIKEPSIFVAIGGSFPGEPGIPVNPHTSIEMWANLTVRVSTQPVPFERLNTTFNGRYYPIIDATIEYQIIGTSIKERVARLFFTSLEGVEPREG